MNRCLDYGNIHNGFDLRKQSIYSSGYKGSAIKKIMLRPCQEGGTYYALRIHDS